MKTWSDIHHGGRRREGAETAGKKEEDMIDFSVNVTPLGIPDNIRHAMEKSLDRAGWYPDDAKRRLKEALAQVHHVEASHICVGNGASDVIYRTVFALRPKRALVLAPTFAEYEGALRCVEAKMDYYRINHDDFQVKEDICVSILPETDIVFLCNPNNPTGLLIEKGLIDQILSQCKAVGAKLVVDECFLEFVREGEQYSVIDRLDEHSELIIIKSFTKMFGIAGLRLGYILCGEDGLAEKIDRFGCNWNINCVAEAAGLEAVRSDGYVNKVIEYISNEREWMGRQLSNLGFLVVPGKANYLLFKNPYEDREEPGAWLLKKGIMLRRCDDYENMDGSYYRIGIGNHADNLKLLEEIGEWLK